MRTYTAEFDSIQSNEYKITITTENGSGTSTLKLGANPFTTSMKSDGKNIYAPIKTTGATITIMSNAYDFDLYTAKPKGSKVRVTKKVGETEQTIFVGYLTPCCYDMGFDNYYEEVELEAVDGLAVLKEIPYVGYSTANSIETLGEVIHNCLKQSGVFTKLYCTDNVQLTADADEPILQKLRISERNFFSKKKDINQSDSDVAWSCYDVLAEIMRFMGYTMYAEGETVYIIDYDAIKQNKNAYYKYNVGGAYLGTPDRVELRYRKAITGEDYGASGTQISLDEVYNKVSVIDEFQTFDNLFPDFGDKAFETNITASSDSTLRDYRDNYKESDIFVRTDKNGNNENFQIFITNSWKDKLWLVIVKFYDSPTFAFKQYANSSARQDMTWHLPELKWSDVLKYHGAFYVKMYKRELKSNDYNKWRSNYPSTWTSQSTEQRYAAWLALLNKEPEALALQPMIICTNQDEYHIGPAAYNSTNKYTRTDTEDCRKYPYITLKGNKDSSIFGGEGSYIIIQGTFRYHDNIKTPYPLADGTQNNDLHRRDDKKYAEEGFIWARLRWGGSYWNGEAWTTTPTDFKLRFWELDRKENDCKNKVIYDTDFDFLDTAQVEYGCKDKGVYIPAPKTNLQGNAEFVIYANRDMWGKSEHGHWDAANRYSRYYSKCVFLTNLNIKATISNGLLDDEGNDSDTVYTNVINSGATQKMSDIKFKVCTYDGKKPTYSSVDYLDTSGNSVYLTKTVNKALALAEGGSISSFDGHIGLTQEEHHIFKLVTQYEAPRVIFKCTLHNDGHKLYGVYTNTSFGSRSFIADEMNVDYKDETATLKLIEKA